jgi:hypothetical protein
MNDNKTNPKCKIGLICFKPNDIYLEFLNKFSNYEVYIIIDDNSVNYTALYKTKYANLSFIQMQESLCKKYGFKNVNKIGIKKQISGWDKALCYFSLTESNTYNKVWFIEDDVFFYNEDTLINIDAKYPDYDLLANCDFKLATNMNEWLWSVIKIETVGPYYAGMMCAARVSQTVLHKIRVYATTYKTLFFLEALLPTISKTIMLSKDEDKDKDKDEDKDVKCGCPDELKTVVYRHKYTYETVLKENIYHPVKNILKHEEFRKQCIN